MILAQMAPSLTAGSGAFVPKRYVEHGVANLVRGGLEIGDGSLGIDYQDWQCTFDDMSIFVLPQSSGVGTSIAMTAVSQASVAMDRSNQPNIAYIAASLCKLRWWDANNHVFATTSFADATRILVVQDDPRDAMSSSCDVVVAYQKAAGGVYFRRQRDRYTIEYVAVADAGGRVLQSFGMGTQNRLLWRCI